MARNDHAAEQRQSNAETRAEENRRARHDEPAFPPPGAAIWFSLFAAPAAWAFQGTASWLLLDSACYQGAFSDVGDVRMYAIGITALALLVAIAALVVSITHYRHVDTGPHRLTGQSRPMFMASLGLLISSVFLLAIVWAAIPLGTLELCEAMR